MCSKIALSPGSDSSTLADIYSTTQVERLVKVTSAPRDMVMLHLSRNEKFCPKCRRWLPLVSGWMRTSQTKDGYQSSCRECTNQKARARYKGIAGQVDSGAAMVPIELFPAASPGEAIGCLRCRHAAPCLLTDFDGVKPGAKVTITCHKQEETIALIWEKCPLADPRPAQPRDLAKYWKKYGPLGDKTRGATPLMVEFLKRAWLTWKPDHLERVTRWNIDKIRPLVRYHKIGGVKVGRSRLHFMDHAKGIASQGRNVFTKEQSDWILNEYRSPRWPRAYIYCLSKAQKAAITRNRNRVIAHVASLGPTWKWEQIQRHIQKRQDTEIKRGKRRGLRPVNQFAAVREK